MYLKKLTKMYRNAKHHLIVTPISCEAEKIEFLKKKNRGGEISWVININDICMYTVVYLYIYINIWKLSNKRA